MRPSRLPRAVLVLIVLAISVDAQEKPNGNLAPTARVTASSSSEGTKPENLNDGDIAHNRWAAKDGTNPADTWVELNWPTAVQFEEVVVRQEGDQKLSYLNIEARDNSGQWRLIQSVGDSPHLLPRLILAQFGSQNTSGLRLSGFAGSVSLNEIEVYNRTDPPVIEVASDLLNHIFGVVTDGFGTLPFANVAVELQGTMGGKAWRASTQTDEKGMFQVEMPVGLVGDVTASAQLANGASAKRTVEAGDLAAGLSITDETTPSMNLSGTWRFRPDPEPEFFQANFSDADWKSITVPSHWIMEGFESDKGTGGYRRHLQIPASFRGRRIKLLFDGVYSGAEVWLNGQRVGSHEG